MTTRWTFLAAIFLAASTQLLAQTTTEESIEGLPPEAPRVGTIITVDVSTNQAYLFQDGQLVRKSPAATASGKFLKQGRKLWYFHTPRGRHQVVRKIVDPIWTKPDWAFIEEGQPVPPANSPVRKIKGHLGKYALDLGEGILIHGTDEKNSIGKYASHGCIRLPNSMLKELYRSADVGTEVFIFDSDASRLIELRSDLDFLTGR